MFPLMLVRPHSYQCPAENEENLHKRRRREEFAGDWQLPEDHGYYLNTIKQCINNYEKIQE